MSFLELQHQSSRTVSVAAKYFIIYELQSTKFLFNNTSFWTMRFETGNACERDLDGVWFPAVVLAIGFSGLVDLRYTDDNRTELGVDPEEVRVKSAQGAHSSREGALSEILAERTSGPLHSSETSAGEIACPAPDEAQCSSACVAASAPKNKSIRSLVARLKGGVGAHAVHTHSLSAGLAGAALRRAEIVGQMGGLEDRLAHALSHRAAVAAEAAADAARLAEAERELEMGLHLAGGPVPIACRAQRLADRFVLAPRRGEDSDSLPTSVGSTEIPCLRATQVGVSTCSVLHRGKLGSSCSPSSTVESIFTFGPCLAPCVAQNLPLVMKNIRATPAWPLRKGTVWTNEYLRAAAGHRLITVRLPEKMSDEEEHTKGVEMLVVQSRSATAPGGAVVFGDPEAEDLYSTESMSLVAYLRLLEQSEFLTSRGCSAGLRYAGRLVLLML